jgi:aspartate carbamoyltransferase regulatory subunit
MIEREANHATVIKQIKKTFLQMLDCFNWVSEGNMTAIKLTIQTNEKTSKRICKLRGLVGSKREVKMFIKEFK